MNRILVVATTPPPYYGQALMAEAIIQARFESVRIYHVRMRFSRSVISVGRFGLYKVIHMFQVVTQAVIARIRYRTPILYYIPGGGNTAPVLRDIFILFFIRPLFSRIIFHYHAAGVSLIVEKLPGPLKRMAKYVYRSSDLSIHLSRRNPDCQYFKTKKIAIIPNGLEDDALPFLPFQRTNDRKVTILFVGVLKESKGVSVLLEAVKLLRIQGYDIEVNIMGGFLSLDYENEVKELYQRYQLQDVVRFAGIKKGRDKWKFFADADIFCFPSFYESESFGNVIVEAMMFELPVVATAWRGIPDIVEQNETGLLVPTKDAQAVAAALALLIDDPEIRVRLGNSGRRKFLRQYHRDRFLSNMEEAFGQVAVP